MPLIWAFMRSAIARPAASSLELFTRKPDDSRCSEVPSEALFNDRLRWAFSDATLVLICVPMRKSPFGSSVLQNLDPAKN